MNRLDKIRVLIIEDNATIIMAGIRNFFRPERDRIEIAGAFTNAASAAKETNPESFDLILLDLMIPGSTPEQNMTLLKNQFPDKPVVIYTSLDSEVWQRRMMALGAHGYVHKNEERSRLKLVIEEAMAGRTSFSFKSIVDAVPSGIEEETPEIALTFLEKEIMTLIASGMNYKPIGKALNIHPDIVETTVKRLRKKMQVSTTPQLIFQLTRRGMI
jgi:two-component system nitrate/nitrite response regulator NarP